MQSENIKEKIVNSKKIISSFINHKHIFLKSRGNCAILDSLNYVTKISKKKNILIQDQGGWLTYKKYPKKCDLKVLELKTDYGIINLNELEKKAKIAAAILYQNPAGYIANQPIKEIYEICKKNNCKVILDVTGCIGDKNLCNGLYADVIVSSFGTGKIVNLGYGGFISFLTENKFDILEDFDSKYFEELVDKLNNAKNRLDKLYKLSINVKKDLKKLNLNIVHHEKIGINVVVLFNNIFEKEKILNYCKNKNFEYTICPRYIRILDDAISIELKRIL
ncbi:MAG: aminotransferase class V-fold PLP-dependent enzyme [Candidatus Woesearchaeota archaeon]